MGERVDRVQQRNGAWTIKRVVDAYFGRPFTDQGSSYTPELNCNKLI